MSLPQPGAVNAQSHRDITLHPLPWGTQWGKTGGQVRDLAILPVISQPPTTAASELMGIAVVQQVFYWGGLENLLIMWKRPNQSRQTSSGEAEEAGHAAPAPDVCLSTSSLHLPHSQVRHRGHTRCWGSAGMAPRQRGITSPHGQCGSHPSTAQERCWQLPGWSAKRVSSARGSQAVTAGPALLLASLRLADLGKFTSSPPALISPSVSHCSTLLCKTRQGPLMKGSR